MSCRVYPYRVASCLTAAAIFLAVKHVRVMDNGRPSYFGVSDATGARDEANKLMV